MLAYLLALVVGLGSLALYIAAFFFPEVHRKNDILWSGVGLFYALVLWVDAAQIRGGLLLGQLAGVSLLGWLAWQTLTLRRQTAAVDQQTPVPTAEQVKESLAALVSPEGISRVTSQFASLFGVLVATTTQSKSKKPSPAEEDEVYVPLRPEDFASAGRELRQKSEDAADLAPETIAETPQAAPQEIVEVAAEISDEAEEVAPEVKRSPKAAADKIAATAGAVSTDVSATAASVSGDVKRAAKIGAKGTGNALTQLPEQAIALLGGIVAAGKNVFKKKENKPIYVRKQYRAEAEIIEADEAVEIDIAVEQSAQLLQDPSLQASLENDQTAEIPTDTADDWFDATADKAEEVLAEEILEEEEVLLVEEVLVEEVLATSPETASIERSQISQVTDPALDTAEDWFENAVEKAEEIIEVATTELPEPSETASQPIDTAFESSADLSQVDIDQIFTESETGLESPSDPQGVAKRPHPPAAELIQAALTDAEVKQVTANPPTTNPPLPDAEDWGETLEDTPESKSDPQT